MSDNTCQLMDEIRDAEERKAIRKKVSEIIFEAMRFDREATTPKWQNGNSDAEVNARRVADVIIGLFA